MAPLFSLPDVFPEIVAGDVVLRRIVPGDAADYERYLRDFSVIEWTSIEPPEQGGAARMIAAHDEAFAAKEAVRWAVARRANRRMIGDCGLHAFAPRDGRAEIGYVLSREAWGGGLMSAAVAAVLGYAFGTLGLDRVEASVIVGNDRSAGLLERLRFTREGTLREYRNRRGELRDVWWYGLLRREWQAQ